MPEINSITENSVLKTQTKRKLNHIYYILFSIDKLFYIN